MRRLAALFAPAAALGLLPAQAASAETLKLTAGVFPTEQLTALSSSDDPFAVGGGTTGPVEGELEGVHFAFSGHCKSATGVCEPGSGTASGYAVVSDPVRGKAQGHVCAMEVVGPLPAPFVGNFAGIGVVVEKGSGFLGSFPYLVVEAVDSGGRARFPSGPLCGSAVYHVRYQPKRLPIRTRRSRKHRRQAVAAVGPEREAIGARPAPRLPAGELAPTEQPHRLGLQHPVRVRPRVRARLGVTGSARPGQSDSLL